MFLLLALWSHLIRLTSTPLMSSTEFAVYTYWSCISFFLYPTLQLCFTFVWKSELPISTVAPQFVYHIECFVVVVLNEIVLYRLRRLRKGLGNTNASVKLGYYCEMGRLLSIVVFLDFIGLFIINVDVAASYKIFHNAKFPLDILTRILYPSKHQGIASSNGGSNRGPDSLGATGVIAFSGGTGYYSGIGGGGARFSTFNVPIPGGGSEERKYEERRSVEVSRVSKLSGDGGRSSKHYQSKDSAVAIEMEMPPLNRPNSQFVKVSKFAPIPASLKSPTADSNYPYAWEEPRR
ncbi:hypothetical protein HDV00_006689 [Rhizophlyctis rosea]|nr:hypothetical protein HDV00_006689 [Rhizophlyctis rosea]